MNPASAWKGGHIPDVELDDTLGPREAKGRDSWQEAVLAGCLGTGMLNKAGCDRWTDKMTEKPGLGDQKGRWWELLSTVSLSGWPDLRVIL